MSETPTRRCLLEKITTAGVAATLAPRTVQGKAPTVRTVEAGIRYDLDIQGDYSMSHLDSRPLFTIDSGRGEVVLAERIPNSREATILEAGSFFDEQPVERKQSVPISPGDREVRKIPTGLSTRMRPTQAVNLMGEHRLPEVLLKSTGSGPRVVLPSGETTTSKAGMNQQIRLEAETVEVKTVTFTDEKVPVGERPEDRWGPAREYGSVEVQATPVVEVVDHGDLVVSRHKFP